MKYNPQIIAAYYCEMGLPEPQFEHRFDGKRKWRFDIAWINRKVAIEVQGGIFSGGRHARGIGIAKDMEKLNRATELGWRLLLYQPNELCLDTTVRQIANVMNLNRGQQ